jgi:hypothetical protein
MDCKCIRKLMVVMMELLILILLKARANNHGHMSFPPSSSPIQLPHFSELNKVQTNNFASTSVSVSQLRIMPSCILTSLNLINFKEQYIHALQKKLDLMQKDIQN